MKNNIPIIPSLETIQEKFSGLKPPRKFRINKKRLGFFLGLVTVILSVVSSFATYFILTGLTPIRPTHGVVLACLSLNFIFIVSMITIIGYQIVQLWRSRLHKTAGAKLHIRIVSLFSIMVAVPAILLAIFASVSLDRGLDFVFSSSTQAIVQNSINIAGGFIRERSKIVAEQVAAMAVDMNNVVDLVESDPKKYKKYLATQAAIRNFPLLFIINSKGEILAVGANRRKDLYLPPLKRDLEDAKDGRTLVISPRSKPIVRALKKLTSYKDAYLYVTYPLDPKVLGYLRGAHKSIAEYKQLQQKRSSIQFAMFIMYSTIALSLLLAAIWIGLWFADRLVRPISRLIDAAQFVSQGNLDTQVRIKARDGDLARLSETFNDMTSKLSSQRDELLNTNIVLDDRRRFMETVLSGVTAGVIGTDADGRITLANSSALALLGVELDDLIGACLQEKLPDFGEVLEKAKQDNCIRAEQQIDEFVSGRERHFAVRVTREQDTADQGYGFVVTFDDITELVAAQRNTAWADIARRIAHEIKNPLTPIQLSAERIRRKYGKQIINDREVFDQCTDTIIRQVGDIGRMVDEFSSFARMPQPIMQAQDVRNVIRDAFFLFKTSYPDIKFTLDSPQEPIISLCDQGLLSQAVTNLVKNASEAIEAARQIHQEKGSDYTGRITVRMNAEDTNYTIEVIDNGRGLPKANRNKLLEPYMTTREKGTGLGLAIVQKITEQHSGSLQLRDAPESDDNQYDNGIGGRGACIYLTIPIVTLDKSEVTDNSSETETEMQIIEQNSLDHTASTLNRNHAHKNKEQGVVDGI